MIISTSTVRYIHSAQHLMALFQHTKRNACNASLRLRAERAHGLCRRCTDVAGMEHTRGRGWRKHRRISHRTVRQQFDMDRSHRQLRKCRHLLHGVWPAEWHALRRFQWRIQVQDSGNQTHTPSISHALQNASVAYKPRICLCIKKHVFSQSSQVIFNTYIDNWLFEFFATLE